MFDAAERKMLYGFLSVIFREPDEETIAIMQEVNEATFASVFPGLPAPLIPSLDGLRESYQALFADRPGGAAVPPYGSFYLEREGSAGASTRLIATLYASAGLDTAGSPEPADYLPTELEFLYYLTEGEQQSRGEETETPPHRWVASQADFFHNFFAPWVGPFCNRLAGSEGAHPFYQWGAELLQRFVELEKARLKVTGSAR